MRRGEGTSFLPSLRERRSSPWRTLMFRNLMKILLIAFTVSVAWTTTSEACGRRRSCGYNTYNYGGYNCGGYSYAGSTGYYGTGQGYNYGYAQPGYGYGQPGYGY